MVDQGTFTPLPGFFHHGEFDVYPGGALLEGMLLFILFSAITDVFCSDFQRAYPSLLPAIGGDNQLCPNLDLGEAHDMPECIMVAEAKGHRFISILTDIDRHLACGHGVWDPHGSVSS